jgi:DNA repair exonuclease SbcCD ATPase subunit
MAAVNGSLAQHVQSLDWLFGQMANQGSETIPSTHFMVEGAAAPPTQPRQPADQMPPDWPQLPSILQQSPEGRTAYEWLRAERQRLEEYTRSQFALIRQNHQAVMARNFQNEEALTRRTQTLNADVQLLASQAHSLEERTQTLAQRESAIEARMGALASVQDELRAAEQARDAIRIEVERQQTILNDLEAQAARVQQGLLQADLEQRWQAMNEKQAELTARQSQMENRYQALEKAEAGAVRRAAELDELEYRLGKEFEKQERQLALERREIEALRVRLQMPG